MKIPIESMNLQMLNVGMAHHDGNWNWKDVCSPFTRIYYVTKGEALLHQTNKTVKLSPQHLYIIPAYTRHSYECSGLFSHYYLHVYEGVKNEMNILDFYDFPTEVDACDGDGQIFERMCQQHPYALLPESNPQSYDNAAKITDYVQRYRDMELWEKMELRGAILTLFSHFLREATPRVWTQDERMQKVLLHIHRNIGQNINIEELASTACITEPYLIRLFKREFNTSPIQYINKKKVERAQLMLYTTNMPVKEVAYALGFADHSYFTRLFRKLSGITPLEYRKRMK